MTAFETKENFTVVKSRNFVFNQISFFAVNTIREQGFCVWVNSTVLGDGFSDRNFPPKMRLLLWNDFCFVFFHEFLKCVLTGVTGAIFTQKTEK